MRSAVVDFPDRRPCRQEARFELRLRATPSPRRSKKHVPTPRHLDPSSGSAACGETHVRLSAGICGVWWGRCRRRRCGPSLRLCGAAGRRKPPRPKGSTAWAHLRHAARSMMDTASPSRTPRHIWNPRRSSSAAREFHHDEMDSPRLTRHRVPKSPNQKPLGRGVHHGRYRNRS